MYPCLPLDSAVAPQSLKDQGCSAAPILPPHPLLKRTRRSPVTLVFCCPVGVCAKYLLHLVGSNQTGVRFKVSKLRDGKWNMLCVNRVGRAQPAEQADVLASNSSYRINHTSSAWLCCPHRNDVTNNSSLLQCQVAKINLVCKC